MTVCTWCGVESDKDEMVGGPAHFYCDTVCQQRYRWNSKGRKGRKPGSTSRDVAVGELSEQEWELVYSSVKRSLDEEEIDEEQRELAEAFLGKLWVERYGDPRRLTE